MALVEEPNVRLLDSCFSICELAHIAIATGVKLSEVVRQRANRETVDYNPIYDGRSEWKLLPAIDHPDESSRCLISGTGLTHLGSARGRQSMHATAPSLSKEPHDGHLVGDVEREPLLRSPSVIDDIDAEPATVATAACVDGTRNGCLHVGHCTRLPAALSGTCICLPQAAFGHLMTNGIISSIQAPP